jgi:hypothetical protein
MRAESQTAPVRVRVEPLGPEADVILAENIELIDRDGEGHYRFDEYRLRVPNRARLVDQIEADFTDWMTMAKQAEAALSVSQSEIAEANRKLEIVDTLMEVGLL